MEEFNVLLKLNLQQFAADGPGGEKTEPATQKKLSDARKDGKVAKSKEIVNAITLFVIFVLMKFFCTIWAEGFFESFVSTYNKISSYATSDNVEITMNVISAIFMDIVWIVAKLTAPVLIIVVVIEVATNVYQVKWMVAPKVLKPKFDRMNPISGFKRIFSVQTLVTLLKSLAIIAICIYIVYSTLVEKKAELFNLYEVSLPQAVMAVGDIIFDLGIKISLFYLVVGFVDYVYQKRKFNKDMMMTKQEVKEEYKESEGDPQIKGQIRRRMREASQRRMMKSVPEADVVITNPTHFAVALKYDSKVADAPIVLAKGADYLAQKIKEIARDNQIEIYENKPLARALYNNVEVGEQIPQELYQAVAEVIAYVYSLKNKI